MSSDHTVDNWMAGVKHTCFFTDVTGRDLAGNAFYKGAWLYGLKS